MTGTASTNPTTIMVQVTNGASVNNPVAFSEIGTSPNGVR